MEFVRLGENNWIQLDRDIMRNMSPFDFRDPWKKAMDSVEGKVWNFFNNTAIDFGYNFREGQYDMAESATEAIKEKHHLAVEAGVGIGKSFGYLVPALVFHKVTKLPVVIATSTIALQEQLAMDLTDLLDMMRINEPFIVAKGKGNYLCIKRAKLYVDMWGSTAASLLIQKGMKQGFYDKKDFSDDLPEKDWDSVNVKEYRKKQCCICEHAALCRYHQMRQMLPNVGITICNQDLLTNHLVNDQRFRSQLLNTDSALIIVDEAHNLESKIRTAHTKRIVPRELKSLARKAEQSVPMGWQPYLSNELFNLYESIDMLFQSVDEQAKSQCHAEIEKLTAEMQSAGTREAEKQLHETRAIGMRAAEVQTDKTQTAGTKAAGHHYSDEELFTLLEEDKFFFDDVNGAYDLVRGMIINADKLYQKHSRSGCYKTRQMEELSEVLDSLKVLKSNLHNYVLWSERGRKGWELCYCPKDIALIGRRLYFDQNSITILTSATMTGTGNGSNNDRYGYCLNGIGFPADGLKQKPGNRTGDLITPISSPFNYDEHAMVYYANDMPHPTREHEAFLAEGIERLKTILDISEGRALVLFTSKSDMRRVARELQGMNLPYKVLMQANGSSQKEVLDAFREDEHAVLLGTGAYWEGINVEGTTLSNVVIFRLPFSVPDPITRTKEEGKKDPLMEVRVPEMIIKLKQGVGRLIRSEEDKGIISIIDSRISDDSHAPYKDQVWEALPIKNRTSDLEEIRQFYRETVMKTVPDELPTLTGYDAASR